MRRWEYVGEGSAKFWEAAAEGCAVTVRFGRNGTAGREQVKEFPSAEAALAHLAKVVAEKERKGYRETGAAEALPQQAPPAAPVEPAAQADQPAERPDEDTVVLPANWLRALHPRRGGTPARSPRPPRTRHRSCGSAWRTTPTGSSGR
ncbi:WGR domain-containing protein [Kitasatospora gansuensis]